MNGCNNAYPRALQSFNDGNIEDAIQLLNPCLTDVRKGEGLTGNLRIEGLRLLTICHLYVQNDAEATQRMKMLLKVAPSYEIRSTDPIEFRYLYYTFRTDPFLFINAKLNANLTFPIVTNSYTIDHNRAGDRQDAYRERVDGGVLLGIDVPLNRQVMPAFGQRLKHRDTVGIGFFSLQLELAYQRHSYLYEHEMHTDPSLNLNYTTVLFRESQQWLEVPIALKYTPPSKRSIRPGYREVEGFWLFNRVVPYVFVGGAAHVLLQSKFSSLNRIADNRQLNNPPVVELTVIDRNDQEQTTTRLPRKRYNFSVMGGVGAKWWAGRDYITAELRFNQKLVNFIDVQNRYQNQTLSHLFGYVDSDALLQHFSFWLGYQHPIFRPRQKKEKK